VSNFLGYLKDSSAGLKFHRCAPNGFTYFFFLGLNNVFLFSFIFFCYEPNFYKSSYWIKISLHERTDKQAEAKLS
jgi:hypothetical protein